MMERKPRPKRPKPKALLPICELGEAIPVGIFEGQVTLTDERVESTIRVVLRPLPTPRVLLSAALHSISHPLRVLSVSLGREKVEVGFPDAVSVPIHTTNASSGSTNSPPMIEGHPLQGFYIGNSDSAHQIVFYTFNFHDFITPRSKPEFRKVAASGGYLITHIVRVYRKNGDEISRDAGEEIMQCLLYFLSFTRGLWCGPVLPTGFDSSGKQRWQRLEPPRASSWRGVSSWFDRHHGNILGEVFPGFHHRWADKGWRESLEKVIYWYVGSNGGSGGVEGSIILSQTALELLAWMVLVEDQRILSSDGFRKLTAADRIRLLMSRLPMSTLIPADLTALNAFAKARNAPDGPQVLTSIRNALVHPGESSKSRPTAEALFQAWDLAQWYVESVLMWLCGHQGEYASRVQSDRWTGQVARVPWADKQ